MAETADPPTSADLRALAESTRLLGEQVPILERGLREETATRRAAVRTLRLLVAAVAVLALLVGLAAYTVTNRFEGALQEQVCSSYDVDIWRPGKPIPTGPVTRQKDADARALYEANGCGQLPVGIPSVTPTPSAPTPAPSSPPPSGAPQPAPTP